MGKQVAGWEFQISVTPSSTPIPLVCKTYRSERSSPTQDVTNSEGRPGNPNASNQSARGYQAVVKNTKRARVVIGAATIDVAENPFVTAGLLWKEGDYVANLKIWPAGTADPRSVETYGSLLITRITRNGDTTGLQPFDIEFESDGEYT